MAMQTGDNLKQLTGDERLGQNRGSEYLGAEDIDPGKEPVVTIEAIWNGLVTLQRGKENKDVISFAEKSVDGLRHVRPLIVNATNRKTLKKLFKSVTASSLSGKRVQLYVNHNVRDPQTGEKTDGIRVRPFLPKVDSAAPIVCAQCGSTVTGYGKMTAAQMAEYTRRSYGDILCAECAKAAKAAQAEADAASDVLGAEHAITTDTEGVNEND